MSKKNKKTPFEIKRKAVERVFNGESRRSVGIDMGFSSTAISQWALVAQQHGIAALGMQVETANKSAAYKMEMIQDFLASGKSQNQYARDFNMSQAAFKQWFAQYKDGTLLEKVNREKAMSEERSKARKFSYEQRVKVVEWVLLHKKDYMGASRKFHASYQQVNNWTRKYEQHGLQGLKDRRGMNKPLDEKDEVQMLREENKRLKKIVHENEVASLFLKKLNEVEGRHRI